MLVHFCAIIILVDSLVGPIFCNTCQKTDIYSYYTKEPKDTCRSTLPKTCKEGKNLDTEFLKYNEEMANNNGLNGLYRPRSALARAFYEKHRNDRQLQEFDQNEWYRVDKSQLSPELQQAFVQLGPDEETQQFLAASVDKSSWVWTQVWYLLAKAVLRHFWTITDINGWLGRGSMFVLSRAQAAALLPAPAAGAGAGGALVDVGAGDGEVSRRFSALYQHRYATEISASMRKALTGKGYTILDTEEWWRGPTADGDGGRFSCVCMLNLLDRCARPRSMLQRARDALAPGGVLLLALVLPYKPYVEVTADHKPEERLPITGDTFEQQAAALVGFMRGAGWALRAWSRAPYLCEGDFAQAYYWLDDSVYVFSPVEITA